MHSRNQKKMAEYPGQADSSGLSLGVGHLDHMKSDRKPNALWDFITQTFLFLLGGVILCGIILALVSFT
ncbi:hypothetical protein QWY16_11780 [Planococcus shenhongbingii]|uniref:hypothetical protein n=1 Tax=Planococcus shenhongbingii TaxID=3058398 RepID=UPI00262B70F9|nr:hypothetical protein [Planococcus sp. N016]WKA57181.1 hypothetical protein QWY16_11780 [Planococcus sp. N016]